MDTPAPLILRLRPGDIEVDNARNLSRAGLAHDPTAVREMADMLLALGQLDPIEVAAPEGWSPEDWTQCVSEHGVGPVARGEYIDRDAAPGLLVYGYRRHAAAALLESEKRTSACWDGRLLVKVAPAGLTSEQIEDRNLAENISGLTVSFVDLGLAAHRLTAAPEDGGRGEEPRVVAQALKVTASTLGRLLLLPQLCEEARALSRLHHRDPEKGITPVQACKLARRPVEEQRALVAAARDAGHNVTPKAMRAAIAPRQGRQGQPPGVTGAQLARAGKRLERLTGNPEDQQRLGITAAQATLARDLLLALVSLDPAALKRLPGALGRLVEVEITREPER